MESHSYTEWGEIFAKRIARCKDGDDRLLELANIWRDIQRLTTNGKPLNESQKNRILRELKKALEELGYDVSHLTLEDYKGTEDYQELLKSGSISNDELREMMRVVAKGPKP